MEDAHETNKWSIELGRVPLAGVNQGAMYMAKKIELNGVQIRCTAAMLTMLPDAIASLHLEIMPRDLEIVMEDEGE